VQFARTLKKLNIRHSVGRTGICYDNAMAESFNAALKNELVHRTHYPTRVHARRDVVRYIESGTIQTSALRASVPEPAGRPRDEYVDGSPQRKLTANTLSGMLGQINTSPGSELGIVSPRTLTA